MTVRIDDSTNSNPYSPTSEIADRFQSLADDMTARSEVSSLGNSFWSETDVETRTGSNGNGNGKKESNGKRKNTNGSFKPKKNQKGGGRVGGCIGMTIRGFANYGKGATIRNAMFGNNPHQWQSRRRNEKDAGHERPPSLWKRNGTGFRKVFKTPALVQDGDWDEQDDDWDKNNNNNNNSKYNSIDYDADAAWDTSIAVDEDRYKTTKATANDPCDGNVSVPSSPWTIASSLLCLVCL